MIAEMPSGGKGERSFDGLRVGVNRARLVRVERPRSADSVTVESTDSADFYSSSTFAYRDLSVFMYERIRMLFTPVAFVTRISSQKRYVVQLTGNSTRRFISLSVSIS